jgi:glycosyltransferase involved in cell wall biosynthesis
MHACMVAYAFYDSDNRIRRYAETLVREGWEVDAFVLRQEGQPLRGTLKGVNLYRIQTRKLREKGKCSYLFCLLGFLFRSMAWLCFMTVTRKYKFVHVHSIPDFEVFSAWLPKLLGTKIILDIHDIVPELYLKKFKLSKNSFFYKMLLLVETLSTRFADHVIIANHIWQKRLIGRSVPGKKCSTILNFPDPEIFFPRKKTVSNRKFVLIYPGTLSIHQGVEIILKAMYLIKDNYPDIELHIYGKGTDEEYFKGLSRQLGLTDVVFFKGFVPLDEAAAAMANADIGIEPKLSELFSDEAFSTKIWEFMLIEVPVIASETTVHKYYVGDDLVTYYPSGDEKALAAAIIKLHADPLLRQRLIANGKRFIALNNWGVKKSEYLDLVGRLLKKN